jgi:hypothetical protein
MKKQTFTLDKIFRRLWRQPRVAIVAVVFAAFILMSAKQIDRDTRKPSRTLPGIDAASDPIDPGVSAPAPVPTPAPAPPAAVPAPPSAAAIARHYDDGSFWNIPIPENPAIAANSPAIVANAILPFVPTATFSNSDAWGISYINATGVSAKTYNIACTRYCTGDSIDFPIPPGAQPTTGSDHHMVVINGNLELDMWLANYDPASDRWSAGVRVVNDLRGWGAFCGRGQHCNGAEASGFALLGGTVRPEEIAQGHIDHALAMITPHTRASFIACPATHTDGKVDDPTAIPEGARVQLDPSFNVDAQPWPAWEKVIAKALQTYGAFVVDTGGALAVRGVTDQNQGGSSWAAVNTPKGANISNIPWQLIRVLEIQSCG